MTTTQSSALSPLFSHAADEIGLKFLNGLPEAGLHIGVQLFLIFDLSGQGGVAALDKGIKLFLEASKGLDRDIIEVAVDTGVNNHDLLLDRQRFILILFKDLHH